jgi:hypothetical protein
VERGKFSCLTFSTIGTKKENKGNSVAAEEETRPKEQGHEALLCAATQKTLVALLLVT